MNLLHLTLISLLKVVCGWHTDSWIKDSLKLISCRVTFSNILAASYRTEIGLSGFKSERCPDLEIGVPRQSFLKESLALQITCDDTA